MLGLITKTQSSP